MFVAGLLLLVVLAIATSSAGAVAGRRIDDSSCGYSLDGVDDYASFSIGSRDASRIQQQGFTMMFWLRNSRKDKDGHFEQCLMSHSLDEHGGEPILKVQLTVESKLALTMRFGNSRKVTCDADLALQDERWYHATVSVPPSNPMAVFVNGVQIKYYCVENKGEPGEKFNADHVFPRVAITADHPVLLGTNRPQDHGENFYKGSLADFKLFQNPMGASDVFHMLTSYPFEYSERSLPVSRLLLVDLPLRANCSSGQPLDSIQGAGQGRPLLRADGEIKYSVTSPGSSSLGNSYTASVRNVHAPPAAHHHFAEVGGAGGADRPYARPSSTLLVHSSHRELLRQRQRVAMLHFSGNPRVQPLNLGDGLLSAMLTVAETKLAFMQYLRQQAAEANRAVKHYDFAPVLGDIVSLVVNGENSLDQLCASLARHFDVQMDESRIWRGYNEYAVRLEMLGHSIALMLKQHGREKSRQKALADKVRGDMACKARGNCSSKTPGAAAREAAASTRLPLVALIVPATSKGVSARELNRLSLGASLLPSLYQTRSAGFNYQVYLTVNEHDPIYSDSVLTHTLFDAAHSVAREKFFASRNASELAALRRLDPEEAFPRIPHRVVLVPDSMLPKRALSALFNIPTLIAAFTDQCDYFYVVNDDLLLKSAHWTEKLVEPLLHNPVLPGLGVSGGIDVSDSITPQIEFPFFSRTHVELFPWCGCNPWVFKNWWEDNWLTDIYLPFDSIFYRRDVVVENYIGLEVQVAVQGSKTGSADPSYAVTEGRRTPFFYMEEVEKARARIVSLLEKHAEGRAAGGSGGGGGGGAAGGAGPTVSSEDLHAMLAFVQGFDEPEVYGDGDEEGGRGGRGAAAAAAEVAVRPETLVAMSRSTAYCAGVEQRTPSLLNMPVAAHEFVLDPCDQRRSAGEHRRFVPEVHSVELPHTSYAGLLSQSEAKHQHSVGSSGGELTKFERDKQVSVSVCRHYYLTLEHFRMSRNRTVHSLDDLDDDVFQDWEACVHTAGLDKFFALKAMQKGELCRALQQPLQATSGPAPPPRQAEYHSCGSSRQLKILILHNHAPLFTRYGSDKRLYHIAETLVGLGHEVVFGGSFVSGLETEDDHLRLHHIDAKLYSPLAIDRGDRDGIYADEFAFSAMLRKEQPDVALMTLWFWNSPPATMLYMDLLAQLAPHVRVGVISDDAHTQREELLLTKSKKSRALLNSALSLLAGRGSANSKEGLADAQALRTFKQVRVLEYLAYAKADVVLTITENDREKILNTKAAMTNVTVPQIDRGRYARGPQPSVDSDYALLMSPLPPEKIRLARYALSPTEIVSNVGLKLRRGERGGAIEGETRAHLSFVGNGANPTNMAAMRWFATDIFDLIRKEIPGVRLMIIGADWEFLRSEFPHFFSAAEGGSAEGEGAMVLRGLLSQEDLTRAVVTSKVFVSPISVSTGLNTKNLLALSRGLPLVTTPLGAEGLLYMPGADESGDDVINPDAPFALATTAVAFARKTVRLYTDNKLWRQVALAALRHARSSFGLSVQAHELEEALHFAFSAPRPEGQEGRGAEAWALKARGAQ